MIKNIILQQKIFRFAYRILHWHIKYFIGRSISPLACGFYITSKCNFRCKFCNIWRIKPSFQMPMVRAQELINELGKMGLIYFSFSGGEPLLVPYIFDLLAYAKKRGIIYTHIVSNGYLMNDINAKRLAEANVSEVSFSLDGDEEFHDRNRGTRGAFNKVFEAVYNVKTYAPKTKIILNTILNPACSENAIFAVKTAERLGVKIKVQPINEHPSFGVHECAVGSRRSLGSDEKQKLLDAIELIQKSSFVVNSRPFLENYKAFIFCPERLMFSKNNCIFGYHHVEVFADQMFPCLEGFNWRDGFDISNGSIREILTSHLYRERLQRLRKCSYCSKNYYICYYEPRLNFPIWNFIKSRLKTPEIKAV